MNYRHNFHAGNFADVIKHAVLVAVLDALCAKDKPFVYIDTHAGRGDYDLMSDAAQRTGEFRGGVARVLGSAAPALAPYLAALAACGCDDKLARYPGSPRLAAQALRPGDRLALVEKHPEEVAALSALFRREGRAQIHAGDGYERLVALLPPAERRGVVLIDPPFERPDEFAAAARLLEKAWKRWPTGVYLLWYPIKDAAAVRGLHAAIKTSPIRRAEAVELTIRRATGERLDGSGLIVVNTPFAARAPIAAILDALVPALATGPGAAGRIIPLTGE